MRSAAERAAPWVAAAVPAWATVVLATQLFGTPSRWVAAIQATTPWMLPVLLAVVLLVSRAGARFAVAGGSATGLALVYLVVLTPIAFGDRGPTPAPDATSVRVVAANVLYSNDRLDDLAAAVTDLDADVVAISEATPGALARLEAEGATTAFPYRHERPAEGVEGLALWSRYPFERVADDDGYGRPLDVVVATPDGPIRIVAVHAPTPIHSHTAWEGALDALPSIVAAEPFPVVVLGDFNASWFHPPFRRAVDRAGLTDAAAAVGDGLVMTWPTDHLEPPFVTLDHVLVGGDLAVVDAGTADLPGSDHRAVVADVALAGR